MAPMRKQSVWKLAITLVLLPALAAASWAEKQATQSVPGGAALAAKIPVGPLGFIAPNPGYLSHRLSFATLDFIDKDHLLFTFHVNQLLPRLPGDPADDDDQIIRAMVLDIGSGKVLRQADWRMHDRGRYLWALRNGEFLVRVRNSLFLTDSSLSLRPYLTFDTELEGVELSPGRGLLMLEMKKVLPAKTEENGDEDRSVPPSLLGPSEDAQRTVTQMVLVRPGERTALGGAEMLTPGTIPLLENGLLDVDEGKKPKEWVIVKKLLDKTRTTVATVKSSCAPQLVMLSTDVVLSQGCPVHGGSGNEVRAFALNGDLLWGDYWQAKYIWPHFDPSDDGSRFAYESLEMNRDMGRMDSFGEDDVVAQPVGVFNTRTGDLVLVKDASPALSAGQNFALSADGRRFAILRQGAIEVYDLPAVVAEEPKVKNGTKLH